MATSIPPTVLEWSKGFASLSPGVPPCPGLRPDEWAETHRRCTAFIDQWGVQAHELGWDTLRLFSVHPKFGTRRGDWTGVLLPLVATITEVNGDFMRIGPWRAWRTNPAKEKGVPIWEFGQ